MFFYRLGLIAARYCGLFAYYFLQIWEIPYKNLRLLFPDSSREFKEKNLKKYAVHTSMQIYELIITFFFPSLIRGAVTISKEDKQILSKYKGQSHIILSLHYGNWEFLGAALVRHGLDLYSMYLKSRISLFDRFLVCYRERMGLKLIEHDSSIRIAKTIRGKKSLALLADQDGGADGVSLTWADQSISFPAGPARLYRKFRIPVLGVYIKRKGLAHVIKVHELVIPGKTEGQEVSRKFLDFYEEIISMDPSQWLLFYDRFKSRTYDRFN